MQDAAASAVDRSSHNAIMGNYDTIWVEDGVSGSSYRFTFGRVRLRGGRGGGSLHGTQRQTVKMVGTKDKDESWANVVHSPMKEPSGVAGGQQETSVEVA